MNPLIETILTSKRCHNSAGELAFMKWLYAYIAELKLTAEVKAEGCVAVAIGKSKVMFSCHVDTVHSQAESDGSMQKLFYDAGLDHIFLADKKDGCLGADDGAGIYIMLTMMAKGVPGTYMFHRGEEKGCIGSRAVLNTSTPWLKTFEACIAFDRPNCDEVIVTQGGAVCASPEYGTAVAKALNARGLKMGISHKGVITDSKIYRQVIPECLNLGVGYTAQHSSDEYLDWGHLQLLTEACLSVEWDKLVPARKIVPEPSYDSYKPRGYTPRGYTPLAPPPKRKGREKQTASAFRGGPVDDLFGVDLQKLDAEGIWELTEDNEITNSIIKLLAELAAERGRSAKLFELLGV